MEGYLNSLQEAIDNKNWYAVIIISLTLPDICAGLEKGGKTYRRDYINWTNKNFMTQYGNNFFSGEDVYVLRCAILHRGTEDLTSQPAKKVIDKFLFIAPVDGVTMDSNSFVSERTIIQLQTDILGNNMIRAVRNWIEENKNNSQINKEAEKIIEIHTAFDIFFK